MLPETSEIYQAIFFQTQGEMANFYFMFFHCQFTKCNLQVRTESLLMRIITTHKNYTRCCFIYNLPHIRKNDFCFRQIFVKRFKNIIVQSSSSKIARESVAIRIRHVSFQPFQRKSRAREILSSPEVKHCSSVVSR